MGADTSGIGRRSFTRPYATSGASLRLALNKGFSAARFAMHAAYLPPNEAGARAISFYLDSINSHTRLRQK